MAAATDARTGARRQVWGRSRTGWIWNDFLWPLIFTWSDEKQTIMLGIVSPKGQYSVAWGSRARSRWWRAFRP